VSQTFINRLFIRLNASYRAIKNDSFVKLTVGQPSHTFLVPRSQIKFGWEAKKLVEALQKAEADSTSSQPEPASPSSDKTKNSRRQSITEALSSPKKWFSPSSKPKNSTAESIRPSSEAKIPEITLPEDDPGAWATFLYWSMHHASDLPELETQRDINLVRLWNLGFKYGFDDFSDDVMSLLMKNFEQFEAGGTVTRSVTADAIRETYCSGLLGESKLKTLVAEEIVKSKLFSKCEFKKNPHNFTGCKNCDRDRADIKEQLKCKVYPGTNHTCGLDTDLWTEIVKAKRAYRDQGHKGFIKRLSKPKGRAPVYMRFLLSAKWIHLRSLMENEK
jgi:hypothetical protein